VAKRKSATKKSGKTRRRKKKWTLNMNEVVPEIAERVIERLGLDYIGITVEKIYNIIEEIVQGIAESRSTKPSIESLVNRIVRNGMQLRKAIAASLVYEENLTPEQLEFIVSYAPEIAGKAAPKLYRIARKYGLDHIIDSLRHLWIQYGKPTPIECPYCGFRSVTPNLECMVCGAQIEEKTLKKSINFEILLDNMAQSEPVAAMEAASAGFVIYDGERLYPPTMRIHRKFYVELYLSREERERLLKQVQKKIKG
jgi:DNA-directed RNA polymerase subunit RPC12/RpoP